MTKTVVSSASHRSRKHLAQTRTTCVVLAVVLVGLMAASARWYAELRYTTASLQFWQFALRDGEFRVGWFEGRAAPRGFHVEGSRSWGDRISFAWRPYHISEAPGFTSASSHHAFAFPIWLAALPAIVAGAYLQGVVTGARRADRSACWKCGYARAGLRPSDACPECGTEAGKGK